MNKEHPDFLNVVASSIENRVSKTIIKSIINRISGKQNLLNKLMYIQLNCALLCLGEHVLNSVCSLPQLYKYTKLFYCRKPWIDIKFQLLLKRIIIYVQQDDISQPKYYYYQKTRVHIAYTRKRKVLKIIEFIVNLFIRHYCPYKLKKINPYFYRM